MLMEYTYYLHFTTKTTSFYIQLFGSTIQPHPHFIALIYRIIRLFYVSLQSRTNYIYCIGLYKQV